MRKALPWKAKSANYPAAQVPALEQPTGGSHTDPVMAADFVAATGIDLLAVSVGNVHIKTSGEEGLDLALLEQINKCVPVPLVLHGGTGITPKRCARPSPSVWPRSISAPISSSAISLRWPAIGEERADPHRLLGMGGRGRCSDGRAPGGQGCRPRTHRPARMPRKGISDGIRDAYARPGDRGCDRQVVGWLKEVGQEVKRGEPLLEVETDKAILPVESPVRGLLDEIIVATGSEVGGR